ncbi:MAG: NADH-quinone oxidoreductase subunit B [Flavobacteriaceae bacterium]|nr:NADH-quinone oxidoreductase subunit B [Flavobacteriaceae bacterium]
MENDKNSQKIVDYIQNFARKQSLFVLAYGTGCGAIEIPATMTSRYDAERFGIRGAATPRQADVLLITGYLSTKTLKRVIRVYEQMQEPKYVIGFGSCTINGGMYFDSYNTINGLDQYLPVDVYINGCMPRPEAVISGFVKLQELIQDGKANNGEKYRENLEHYRTNQKKIIKNWKMPDYNW